MIKNPINIGVLLVTLALGTGGIFVLFSSQKPPSPSLDSASNTSHAQEVIISPRLLAQEDNDNDGLKDWEEIIMKTDPHNPDTDGDGTPDGEEIEQNRLPLNPNSHDSIELKTSQNPAYPLENPVSPTLTPSTEAQLKKISNPRPQYADDLDREVFHIMNPPSYISLWATLQDELIAEKWMAEHERIPLDSEEHVISFIIKSLDYSLAEEGITPREYAVFKEILPGYYLNLKRWEAENLRYILEQERKKQSLSKTLISLSHMFAYSSPRVFPPQSSSHTLIQHMNVTDTIRILSQFIFSPKAAFALEPVCFRTSGVAGPAGFNSWAPRCTRKGKVYGCLTDVCAGWPNALWDSTTGICGCG
ncbi:MAG: hypothetical protein U1A25_03160 [Candidatus Sungbacteria bacterium]|nr:hypothetical protein [bacterium]MDZ4260642.1 hypothetical protein [Candidatus Sungbacteria bacterium]